MIKLLDDIKIYFLSRRKFLERKDEVERLIKENKRLTKDILSRATAELVIKKIMGRGIEWYDFNDLDDGQKLAYYNDVQGVLKSGAFINELNRLVADQVQYIARESHNHEETMNIRMTINAVDLIKNRLESIPDPRKPRNTNEDIYSAI